MTVVDLNLVKLNYSLIVFYYAIVLQHQLCLIIHHLLCNRVTRPRVTVAFEVQLCLSEQILDLAPTSPALCKS